MYWKRRDPGKGILFFCGSPFSIFIAIVLAIASYAVSAINHQTGPLTSDFKIEKAYHDGRIGIDQRALYHAYALLKPSQLPSEFQGEQERRCATWVLDQIFQTWHQLSPSTQNELEQLGFRPTGSLSRPGGLDSSRTTRHFRIHYSVASGDTNAVSSYDGDGNGTPDYIDMVMNILEYVWTYFEDTLSYNMPPSDSIAGGDSLYDVYIFKLEHGVYGYVQPERIIGDNPRSPLHERYSAISFMALRNNYDDFSGTDEENLKVTVAHEFFHAIQDGYDEYQKAWLKEATAAWVEDVIYDEINNNYQYLPSWFDEPYIPLDADSYEAPGHWYGSWIFFQYLTEHVGGVSFIRSIWERSVAYDTKSKDYSMHIIKERLNEIGTTFEETFQNFALTNWFRTIPPYNYEEGANFPHIYSICSLWGENSFRTYLKRYANDYFIISPNLLPANGVDKIRIIFTPIDTNTRFAVLVASRIGNTIQVDRFYPTDRTAILENTQSMDEILVIVSNVDTAGSSHQYQLALESNSYVQPIFQGELGLDPSILKIDESKIVFISDVPSTPTQNEHYSQLNIINVHTGYHNTILQKGYPLNLAAGNHTDNIIWTNGDTFDPFLYGTTGSGVQQLTQYYGSDKTSPPPFSLESGPDVDNNRAWVYGHYYLNGVLQATGLFTISTIDLTITKIYEVEALEGKIVTDGDWTAFGYEDYNNWDKEVLKLFNGVNSIPVATYESPDLNEYTLYQFDFNDSLLVWVQPPDSFPTLRAYSIGNWVSRDLDGNPTTPFFDDGKFYRIRQYAAGKDHVIWVRTYWKNYEAFRHGDYPDSSMILLYKMGDPLPVKLWSDIGDIYWSGLVGTEGLSPFVFDNNGVGWIWFLGYDGAKFVYYDFSTQKMYTLLVDRNIINLNTAHNYITYHPFTIIDGVFYVDALRETDNDVTEIVAAVDIKGQNLTKIAAGPRTNIPTRVQLEQNYPNPFNATTTIPFYIPHQMHVELTLFDLLGRKVKTLLNKELSAGHHSVQFDASALSSGVYYYQLKAGNVRYSRKMILLK